MSGQTISEKIFSMAANKVVHAGEFVFAGVDCAMANDITAPLAVQGFNEILAGQKEKKVWDPRKVVMVFDHQAPADSLNAANIHNMLRQFAKEQNLIIYDVCEGVCHQIMVEKGYAKPGDLVVGADSHTCTYGALGAFATGIGSTDMASVLVTGRLWFKVPHSIRFGISGRLPDRVCAKDVILHIIGDVGADGATYAACEYAGPTVRDMNISERMTLCNMAIEMGGKTGIVEPDKETEMYLKERIPDFKFNPLGSDEDANYMQRREYDISELEPQVACPHNVDNVKNVSEVEGTKIDQVFIGSCTNGRFEDLKVVAEILDGNKIAGGIRVIIIPASRDEYMKALNAGFIETFIEAGAAVGAPCCGPCMGGSFGLLGDGEVGLATSNRNFRGRQGSAKAFVYLCSPATAAASAVNGKITDPRTI